MRIIPPTPQDGSTIDARTDTLTFTRAILSKALPRVELFDKLAKSSFAEYFDELCKQICGAFGVQQTDLIDVGTYIDHEKGEQYLHLNRLATYLEGQASQISEQLLQNAVRSLEGAEFIFHSEGYVSDDKRGRIHKLTVRDGVIMATILAKDGRQFDVKLSDLSIVTTEEALVEQVAVRTRRLIESTGIEALIAQSST